MTPKGSADTDVLLADSDALSLILVPDLVLLGFLVLAFLARIDS